MGFSLGGLTLLILGSLAQVKKPDFIVMLFVLSALFGASAAIILHFLGGRPIQPVIFMLPFLLIYFLRMPQAMKQVRLALANDRSVQSLVIFTIISLVVTIYAPIFMHGETLVYDVDDGKFVLRALSFGGSHLAQIMYLIGSAVCFILVVGISRVPSGRYWFAKAILFLTAMNALFGFIDLLTFYLGYTEALSFIKNAGYAVVDQSMHGLRRISGAFSETSSFSSFSVGLLAFSFILYLSGHYRPYSGILAGATLLLLILTTSSSAYLGLVAVAIVVIYSERSHLKYARIKRELFVAGFLVVLVAIFSFILFSDEIGKIFSSTVVEKLDSDSGVERMSWNQQAWENTIDTNYIGVGLGGNRASSLLMVVLSNVGIVGFLSFSFFLFSSFYGKNISCDSSGGAIATAAKSAALVMIFPALVGATSFYLGLLFYIFLALGCSVRGLNIENKGG